MTYRTNAEQSEPDEPETTAEPEWWRETLEAVKAVARELMLTAIEYAELILAVSISAFALALACAIN